MLTHKHSNFNFTIVCSNSATKIKEQDYTKLPKRHRNINYNASTISQSNIKTYTDHPVAVV